MARLQDPTPLAKETEEQFVKLREPLGLRLVEAGEDGTGSEQLPAGVYGFTYSPFEDNFPFFIKRELRNYESQKTKDGEIRVVGFLSPEEKKTFSSEAEGTIHLYPEPRDGATEIVSVSKKNVVRRVEYSQRGGQGLEIYFKQ